MVNVIGVEDEQEKARRVLLSCYNLKQKRGAFFRASDVVVQGRYLQAWPSNHTHKRLEIITLSR